MKCLLLSIVTLIFIFGCVENKPSITEPEPDNAFVKIITPNGGEVFLQDSIIVLSWEYNDIDSVRSSISYNGGISWETNSLIYDAHAFSQNIKIDNLSSVSDSCLFRLECAYNPELFDISDSLFAILLIDSSDNNDTTFVDTSYSEYLQFEEGNFWINYIYIQSGEIDVEDEYFYEKSVYDGIEEFNNNRYHRIKCINLDGEINYSYFRIDLDKGYLLEGNKTYNFEKRKTVLNLEPGNHQIVSDGDLDYLWINVSEEIIELFGEDVNVIHHDITNGEMGWDYYFTKKHGIIQYESNFDIFGSYRSNLIGCFINNIIYGDTSFTSINPNAKHLVYYPLAVGNNWSFNYYEINMSLDSNYHAIYDTLKTTKYYKMIEKDTLINNLHYFRITTTMDDSSYILYEYERIDTLNALIYRYNHIKKEELLIDRLDAPLYSTYHDTYRFYNDDVISTDISHGTSYNINYEYRQILNYGAGKECIKEIYDYRLEKNVGLSNLRAYKCGTTINTRWDIMVLELFDYTIVD